MKLRRSKGQSPGRRKCWASGNPLPHAVPGQWGALAGLIVVAFFTALEFSRVAADAKI